MTQISWVLGSLLATLVIYFAFFTLYVRCRQFPLLHPLIGSTLCIVGLLSWFGMSLSDYQKNTQLLSYLLGPATVALAVPLFKQLHLLKRFGWRVLLPIVLGGMLAPLLSWLSIYWLDLPINLQMTMLVKSITTPLAMDTSSLIGGIADLAAVLVISTGIIIAILGPMISQLLKQQNQMVNGIALGTVGHAIATARAVSYGEVCLAFSSLALCLNGLVTSIVLPLLFG
ncbi:LrgB family protein [Glaciecola sp. 1036]|uniref:LrgB family protein n=1 Tax=Alteromonadaceae TaxID=72275 RepID=UPI003CFDAFF2